MADNKGKTPVFHADSYSPVHDSFTSTNIHNSSEDQHAVAATSAEVDTRLENLGKAEAKDNWCEAGALWMAKTINSVGGILTGGAKFITDPVDNMNIPTSIDLVGLLSLIDEVSAASTMFMPFDYPSLVEAAGYKKPEAMATTFMKKMKGDSNDFERINQEAAEQEQEYQESKKGSNLDLPFLKPVSEWWESHQDNKANWWGSEAAWWLDNQVVKAQDYMGAIDTGNKKWDYILNGSSGLVGSIGGSMLMGMGFGKLATAGLNSERMIDASLRIQKASKALANAAISTIQTGGETAQVAGDMYKRSISEQIEDIGGEEFKLGQGQAMQDAINFTLAENPEVDKRDLQYAAFQAGEKYKEDWAKNNPEAFQQIEKNALKGYHMATAINTINLVLEPLQTSMYLRGSVRSRGMLSKPSVLNWKTAVRSGVSEYGQENINTIAEEAGIAEAKGEKYDLHSAFNYATSLKGFEDGAWGFVGGYGEGAFTGMATYKARKKEYEAQLEVIKKQNNIGSADASSVSQFTNLDNSYKGSVVSAKRIAAMEQSGDIEGAKLESERMLRYQAQQAFVSGTTKNLIENYEKIAASDKFSDEAKDQANKAVGLIKEMEKEFNDSRSYLNADEVYYNRTDQNTIKRAIQEEQQRVPEVQVKGLEDLTSFLKVHNYEHAETDAAMIMENLKKSENPFNKEGELSYLSDLYEDLHPKADQNSRVSVKNAYTDLYQAANIESNITNAQKALIELQAKHTRLTSKATQNSEHYTRQFYTKIAQWEDAQKKSNPEYSRYESKEYDNYFTTLLEETKSKLNSENQNEILNNYNDSKKLFVEVKEMTEKAVAKQMAQEQAEIQNDAPVDNTSNIIADDPDLIGQAVNQYADMVDGTEAGSPINNNQNIGFSGTMAADYLFTGGVGVMLSTDYLLSGLSGAFTNASKAIESIKNKYFKEINDNNLGNIKDFVGTDLYNKIMKEIKDAINNNYSGNEASQILDQILQHPTGLPVKLGNELSIKLDNLNSPANLTVSDGAEELFGSDNLGFDPKIIPDNISDEMKNQMAIGVQQLYGLMKGDNANFTFRDLLAGFIAKRGLTNAENHANALIKGWIYAKLPGYETLNFNEIKEEFFKTLDQALDTFMEFSDKLPAEKSQSETKSDIEESNSNQELQQEEHNNGQTEYDKTGTKSVVAQGDIINSTDASIAHVSTYNQEINIEKDGVIVSDHKLTSTEIYIDQFAPGNVKLLHPSMFTPGTKLTAKVHPEFMDVPVNVYDKEGKVSGRMTFFEWLAATNNERKNSNLPLLDEQSAEFIAKVPMAIVDTDGEIVGFVPDLERISDYHNTKETQDAYRKSVLDIRNSIANNKVAHLKVTHKTLGFTPDLQLPYEQAKLLKDCDPSSIIAVCRAKGLQFVAGQTPISQDQIVFDKRVFEKKDADGNKYFTEPHPRNGYSYDLRKCGVITEYNSDGTIKSQKDQYYPFYTILPTSISEEAQSTIYWAINAYLNKNKDNHPDYQKILRVIYGLKAKSNTQINLDEHNNVLQLNNLLKMFVLTHDITGTSIENVVSKIQTRADVNGTPFIFTQKGKIVIGTAFPKIVGNKGDISGTNYIVGDPATDTTDFMQKLQSHIPLLRQNIGSEGFNFKGAVPIITRDGEVKEGYKNYDAYIRSTLSTEGDVRDVTINRNGKQETFKVSFVQPRIDIVLTDDQVTEKDVANTLQTGVVSEANIELIARKILNGEKLTPEEKVMQINASKEVQDRTNALQQEKLASEPVQEQLFPFQGMMLTKAELQAKIQEINQGLKNIGIKPKEDNTSHDPIVLSDEQRDKIIASSQVINGLSSIHQKQIVDYIFNQISIIVNNSVSKSINLEMIKKAVKDVFENNINKRRAESTDILNNLKAVLEIDPTIEGISESIARQESYLEQYDLVTNNWPTFEDQALIMVKKYMNIKEKINTDLADATEDTENDTDINEISGEKDNNYSKTSLEVSGKESVSADIKRLCQSIEEVNAIGEPVLGIFDLPTYVGFDTVFNSVSAWLAESDADYTSMENILKQYAGTHKWIPQLLEKLNPKQDTENPKPINKQLQNEFVTAMCKHALDMEFVMMVKDRTGNYSLKIYSTNSGAIGRSLLASWKSNILTTRLIMNNKEGNYVYNRDAILDIMAEFEELKSQSIVPSIPKGAERPFQNAVAAYIGDKKIKAAQFFEVLDTRGNKRSINAATASDRKTLLEAMDGGKVKIKYNDKYYTLEHDQKADNFVVRKLESPKPVEALVNWLSNFGIEISPETANDIITKGFKYDSRTTVKYEDQWKGSDTGKDVTLLGTLQGTLQSILTSMESINTEDGQTKYLEVNYNESDIDGDKILGQSIINSLAAMEAKHTTHRVVQSFYDNHKSIYGFTASKYITDRVKALKLAPEQNEVLRQLLSTSFSKNSLWLNLLSNDAAFRDNFKVIHLGLTALKELGKTLYRDNDLQALSDIDHELVKLGFFQQDQGAVNTVWTTNPMYTGLNFRLARMFSPTMSDKGTMTMIKTAVLNITESSLKPLNYDKLLNFTYSQVVSPEMERISNFKKNIKRTNIKAYDKGAVMFFMMPALNNMKFNYTDKNGQTKEISLLTALGEPNMTLAVLENTVVELGGKSQTIKEHIKEELDAHIKHEQEEKIKEWKIAKFAVTNEAGDIVSFKFLDKNYMYNRGARTADEKIRIAALDFSVNSMIANANSFMTIAGDPATCFKKDKSVLPTDYDTIVEQTLTNVGKRLADQIAPRNKLADSETNKYIQLFLADTYRRSERIKYLTRSLDGKEISDDEINRYDQAVLSGDDKTAIEIKSRYPNTTGSSPASDYFSMESTNAQEYTTWKEHLYVLEKLGKLPNVAINITQQEIEDAREIFSGNKKLEDLSDAQKALVQKVLQPMKPVYTGQVYSKEYDVMRKMYIKTSSFPLIPQLTAGLEIDKLAKAMERLEEKTGKTVRASYDSGNKVGSIADPMKTSDSSGNFLDFSSMNDEKFMDHMNKFILELPRSNFGIQQNVPFKSELKDEDVVSMGTQITKLLFGNIVMKLKDFNYNGQNKSGLELHKIYADTFNEMVKNLRNDLYNELSIDPKTGFIKDKKKTLKKLESILKSEASLRGYPKQDLDALGIDPETGNFNLPIWLSPNAMRYEALLAAIITHRIVKVKFPGYSYVAGSQAGFKMQDNLTGIDQSNIVFTDKWTGELKGNQVLMPCKLRVDGKMVDLIKDGYAKKDESGKWIVDTEKVDPALLTNIPSFRIPSSKHSSMENLEIAGFLPYNSADLMIVSADGTIAMGEDYDVDKRYTYHQWTTVEHGKIIPLQDSDIYKEDGKTTLQVVDELLADNEQQIVDLRKAYFNYQNKVQQIQDLLDEIDVAPQYGIDITEQQKRVDKMQRKLADSHPDQIKEMINELRKSIKTLKENKTKLYQNQIVNIHSTVLSHPEVKKLTIQKLSIEEAADDAEFLDNMSVKDKRYFTPLSDRYQKSKVAIGAVGKNGTAAYSLDVVSHSLFEQAYQSGNPIQLIEYVEVEDDSESGHHTEPQNLIVTFGGITSTGELGHERTLDGKRTISEVNSERQNLMVDNEKEQIAIRVHLNDYTMKVDKVLNMLGFDKGEDGRSISFMFISQPIIKQYVKMMDNENSNTTEYDSNKRERIINQLLKECGFDSQLGVSEMNEMMTNQYMISQIQDGGSDKGFQAAILMKFLKLETYGTNLTTVQTALNVDSKGIGKNLLEAMEKLESIKELPNNAYIQGVSGLIGDYQLAETEQEILNLIEQGYIPVGREKQSKRKTKQIIQKLVMVKPTTVSGTFAVNGLTTATQIWGKYFPYKDEPVKHVFDEIMDIIGSGEMSDSKKVEIKQMIFNDMKKYLYTDNAIGSLEENAQKERFRLFFDEYGKAKKGEKVRPIIKQSLASFLHDLSKNNSPEVKKLLRSNRLLSRFQYEISTNGNPSLIKFNNSAAENFDEQFMYNSIIELVEANTPLGQFNKKDYTSADLAQDLVAYAYLEGGIQEAVQFVKYLPVSYLKVWGINNIVDGDGFIGRDTLGSRGRSISVFTKQFIQHHAGQVKKVTEEDLKDSKKFKVIYQSKSDELSTLQRFKLESGDLVPFLSIYNEKLPKGQSKYQLYQLDKITSEYVRIPVLGAFGMSEYMAEKEGYQSLVNQPKNLVPPVTSTQTVLPNERTVINRFQTLSNDPKKIVESISQMDSPMGKLAKQLLPLVSRNTKFEIIPMDDANGKFDRASNTIKIAEHVVLGITTNEELATVIMRETVHSISDLELQKYTNALPINPQTGYREFTVTPDAPVHIKRLIAVFGEAQKILNKDDALKKLFVKGRSGGITQQESLVTYGGYDIFEFVERMMTTPELRAELDKHPFRESGLSISQKFIEWLTEVMAEAKKTLGLDTTEGTITDNAMESIFKMFNAKQEQLSEQKKEDFKDEQTIYEADVLLGGAMTQEQEQTGSIEDLLGSPMTMTSEQKSMFDDGDMIIDESDEFAGLDPKLSNFDAVMESMLKSGSLTIKC